MSEAPLTALRTRLGVDVSTGLLSLALTHRSYAFENGGLPSNERLEFLGDSVLGLVVTDALYRRHPDRAEVVGLDISPRMLDRARRKAEGMDYDIELHQMDAQQLDFPDDSFDGAVATFVFCSVPNAEQGLRELARTVKPRGQIILLEHVRINRPGFIGTVMDWLDPLVVRLMGPHINRRTAETVERAGLELEQVEDLAPLGLVKLMVARSPA